MLDLEGKLKLIGVIVTLGGLALGVANYLQTARKDAETRRIESRKQFLTRQLALYTEATQTAAKLVTAAPNSPGFTQAKTRFWELYWGELSMVESRKVEGAMVNMGKCLNGSCSDCSKNDLEHCSLDLAHACRQSLAESWGVEDWRY
jgi:hypothetical protein